MTGERACRALLARPAIAVQGLVVRRQHQIEMHGAHIPRGSAADREGNVSAGNLQITDVVESGVYTASGLLTGLA